MSPVRAEPALHPEVTPLAFLLGMWVGEGQGLYPTIETFEYGEEIRFWHVGKPWLGYAQRTWALDDGRALHSELGYWRPQPGDRLEVAFAHPTGLTEIDEGTVRGTTLELTSTSVQRTSTAKEVTAVVRRYEAHGHLLSYSVAMAAVGQPLQLHLRAELEHSS
jgi:hypothetical protein